NRAVKPGEQADVYRALFGNVIRRVQRIYPQEVEPAAMITAAVKVLDTVNPQSGEPVPTFKRAVNAALAAVDPHTNYLDAREHREERANLSGAFGGLGIQVDLADGLVRVVSSVAGTPAARAGLVAGDLIVRFDDQPVQGMTLGDAVSRMRGEPGTP